MSVSKQDHSNVPVGHLRTVTGRKSTEVQKSILFLSLDVFDFIIIYQIIGCEDPLH